MKTRLNTPAAVKAYMPFPVVNAVNKSDLSIDTDQEMEECRECDLSIEYLCLMYFPIPFLWAGGIRVLPKVQTSLKRVLL